MERLTQSVKDGGARVDWTRCVSPFIFRATGITPGMVRVSGASTLCAFAPSVEMDVVTAAAVVATPVALARDKNERLLSFSRVVMHFESSLLDGILLDPA